MEEKMADNEERVGFGNFGYDEKNRASSRLTAWEKDQEEMDKSCDWWFESRIGLSIFFFLCCVFCLMFGHLIVCGNLKADTRNWQDQIFTGFFFGIPVLAGSMGLPVIIVIILAEEIKDILNILVKKIHRVWHNQNLLKQGVITYKRL